jgi:hypothetical protein
MKPCNGQQSLTMGRRMRALAYFPFHLWQPPSRLIVALPRRTCRNLTTPVLHILLGMLLDVIMLTLLLIRGYQVRIASWSVRTEVSLIYGSAYFAMLRHLHDSYCVE